jgi:hypothetical protein
MEIENNKLFAKKNIVRSLILLVICTPLLFGAILKLFYYLPKDENPISTGLINGIQDLISRLYHGFKPIQYLWPVSPTPSIESVVTSGNLLTAILFLGVFWGIMSFQSGVGAIDELSRAKHDARKKRLEDEYRNRY